MPHTPTEVLLHSTRSVCGGELGNIVRWDTVDPCALHQVLFLESLRLHKQLHGSKDHADVAHGLATLALLHQDSGQLDRALELAQVSSV